MQLLLSNGVISQAKNFDFRYYIHRKQERLYKIPPLNFTKDRDKMHDYRNDKKNFLVKRLCT